MDIFYHVSVFWRSKLVGTEGPAATCQTLLINCRAKVAPDNHCRENQSNGDEGKDYDRFSHSWFFGVLQSPSLTFVFHQLCFNIFDTGTARRNLEICIFTLVPKTLYRLYHLMTIDRHSFLSTIARGVSCLHKQGLREHFKQDWLTVLRNFFEFTHFKVQLMLFASKL